MPEPARLRAYRRCAEWAIAAAVAQELGVFEALAGSALSMRALAEELTLDRRGLRALLGVLQELRLVRVEDGEVRLTGQGRARFVDRDAPDFEGDATRHWLHGIRGWASDLPEAVRHGAERSGREESSHDDPESLARFMAAMDSKEPELVRRVVDLCLERLGDGRGAEASEPGAIASSANASSNGSTRVLDLGGGPGTFTREFVRRGATVTLADRPEVIDYVGDAYGLARLERATLWGGDFTAELPSGPFDVVLLSNITHIYDPETNRALLERLGRRIRRGGTVAIVDFVRGISEFGALFALTMLLHTEGGGTYTLPEYERWLRQTGYERVRCASVDADRQLITARAAGGT